MTDELIRKGADAPIDTTVKTATVTPLGRCAHGIESISVDGAVYHQDGRWLFGQAAWSPCEPQRDALTRHRLPCEDLG